MTNLTDRRDAPAFHRNHGPIGEVLVSLLKHRTGHVIEVGCGTGQHAVAFARLLPDLVWWPTDPDPDLRASAEAWRVDAGLSNLRTAVALDAAASDWRLGTPGMPPADDVMAVVSLNVLHIAPWAVARGLFAGAARALRPDGILLLYGPFARDGMHTAESNVAFDQSLRSRDPRWGVRDIADVEAAAAEHGLRLERIVPMPANNLVIVLRPDTDL